MYLKRSFSRSLFLSRYCDKAQYHALCPRHFSQDDYRVRIVWAPRVVVPCFVDYDPPLVDSVIEPATYNAYRQSGLRTCHVFMGILL